MNVFHGAEVKDLLSIVASIVGIVVVPFTLLGLWRSRLSTQEAENWRARQEEIGTYNDINNRYTNYLSILLENSDLEIGEFEIPKDLDDSKDIYRRKLIYAMLVSLFERAYLLYMAIDKFDAETKTKRKSTKTLVRWLDRVEGILFGRHRESYEAHVFRTQWPGWVRYFEFYCGHPAFQDYWMASLSNDPLSPPTQWSDSGFEAFVNEIIGRQKRALVRL